MNNGTGTPDYSEEPALTVSAVARRLGVEPATLRTWHRRYGLGPSAHCAGRHRRYTAADLHRLDAMRRLVQSGVAPADAARAVTAGEEAADAAVRSLNEEIDTPPGRPIVTWDRTPRDRPGGPGGRVLAAGPGAPPVAKGLARSASALDSGAVTGLLDDAIAEVGPSRVWDELLRPLLSSVGSNWESTGTGVEVEHLLSDIAGACLRRVARAAPDPAHGRPVLLACAPGEDHNLPMAALSAVLAEKVGIGSRLLGAGIPAASLGAAITRTGPSVVIVWALRREAADPAVFRALPATRPAAVVVAAGPGWIDADLPAGVLRAVTMEEAVDAVRSGLPVDRAPVSDVTA